MDTHRAMTVYFYTNGKPQRKPDKVNVTLEDIMAGKGIRVAKNDTFLYNDKVVHHTNGAQLKKLRSVVDQSKFVLVPSQEQFVSAPYEEMFPFHYGSDEEKKKLAKLLIVETPDPDKLFCPHHNRYCKHNVKRRPKTSCCSCCCGEDDNKDHPYTVAPTSSKKLEVVKERSPPQVMVEQQQLDDHVDVKSTPTSSTIRDLGRQLERIDFECTHGTHAMKIYRFGRRRSHRKKRRSGCCCTQNNSDSEQDSA